MQFVKMSVKDAAIALEVSQSTIRRRLREGELKGKRGHERWDVFVPVAEAEAADAISSSTAGAGNACPRCLQPIKNSQISVRLGRFEWHATCAGAILDTNAVAMKAIRESSHES